MENTQPNERLLDDPYYGVLPERYHLGHDLAMYLHDTIVATLRKGAESGIFAATIELKDESHAIEIEELSGEKLWSWLESNGYDPAINEMAYRAILPAVTSDLCHFLLSSLQAASKGKMAVAFALLRKPLKENLLILEWLTGDAGEFLQRFRGDDPMRYNPSKRNAEKRREIVEKSCAAVRSPIVDAEFLVELRYGRNEPYSLENLWQKATHLVTNWAKIKTEPMNFNFIFSSETAIGEQWDHYYQLVPYTTFYISDVLEHLMSTIATINKRIDVVNRVRKSLGFMLWSQSHEGRIGGELARYIGELEGELDMRCEQCAVSIPLDQGNMRSFWWRVEVTCRVCGETADLVEALYPPE